MTRTTCVLRSMMDTKLLEGHPRIEEVRNQVAGSRGESEMTVWPPIVWE